MDVIRNKVAESGLITLDLVNYLPVDEEVSSFDLKPFLFRELILREKDFRAGLIAHDWEQYKEKHVAVFCSADAIVPVWAYMLIATYLQPIARSVYFGKTGELKKNLLINNINSINTTEYLDKKVVIKGCGDIKIDDAAYVAVTAKLQPAVRSLMYGEPCSTVPVYKKPITKQAG